METSSELTASSKTRICGLVLIALAMQTLCSCPHHLIHVDNAPQRIVATQRFLIIALSFHQELYFLQKLGEILQ